MCEPTTLVAVAQAAGTGLQMYGAHQEAEARAEYQEDSQEAAHEQAKLDAQAQQRDLAIQQALQDAQRGREAEAASRQHLQAQGTAQAHGASAGIAGGTYDAILREYYGTEASYRADDLRNHQLSGLGLSQANDRTHNALHGSRPRGVINPRLDMLATGLGIASAGVQGYMAAGGTFGGGGTEVSGGPAVSNYSASPAHMSLNSGLA